MASQMMVPASKDTLFIRGFTGRKDIQDIREYFERQAGCDTTIEFFKQSEMDDALYIALKFETRDIAKDIKNRYDDTEVLGERVEMSWFKDLRKAKNQANLERQQRYGRMDYNNYGRFNNRRRSPMNRGRHNRDSRSASRSRSRSHSGSRKRSKGKGNRASSSRSGSSSPEPRRTKSSSKLRSMSKHNLSDAEDGPKISKKQSAQEDAKGPNSPDRHSNKSQDILKPSPKLKHSDDLKASLQKRGGIDDDESLLKQARAAAALGDDSKFGQMTEELMASRLLEKRQLEQQRLKRRQQELDLDEMSRYSAKGMRMDKMADPELTDRRRAMRAFSPDLDTQERSYAAAAARNDDDRVRGRAYDTAASTMFWDDLDEPRKAKALSSKTEAGLRGMRHLDDEDSLRMRMMDDDDRWGYGSDMVQRRAQMSRQVRDMEFSQDAMILVQEKKKDIEKIYKNDCETFVTVVKMLISKEPSLEEKLQFTLRENLKEIGQRCILDLREYMDRLREHDSMPGKMSKV